MRIDVCDICRSEIDIGTVTIRARKLQPGGISESDGYWSTVDICINCQQKIAEFVKAARDEVTRVEGGK